MTGVCLAAGRRAHAGRWLLVFWQGDGTYSGKPTGNFLDFLDFLDFLAPGILAQSALFVSISYGIAVIWERDLGYCTSSW
jgi:ABC-2 type transport system permease protein